MFNEGDLAKLDDLLLSRAVEVRPMIDVARGLVSVDGIGMRHDVDDNPGSLATALRIGKWEHERGYRSTYFMLHTASYWRSAPFGDVVKSLVSMGHEVGIHANALAHSLRTGDDPDAVLGEAIGRLRGFGVDVLGVAGHGDGDCYFDGRVEFANDEQFTECARPELGAADRVVMRAGHHVRIRPRPLAFFGLEYESLRAGSRGLYLSDSGGQWKPELESLARQWYESNEQLHVLWHPDWWPRAFGVLSEAA